MSDLRRAFKHENSSELIEMIRNISLKERIAQSEGVEMPQDSIKDNDMENRFMIQSGRIVAKALVRSKAYKIWHESSEMEYAMSGYYGVAYSLDDEKIIDSALRAVAVYLSKWIGLSVDDLIEAYNIYTHCASGGVR